MVAGRRRSSQVLLGEESLGKKLPCAPGRGIVVEADRGAPGRVDRAPRRGDRQDLSEEEDRER
jgi:hypothetical protein